MLHAGSSSDKTHLKIGLNFTLAPLLANCIRSGPLRGSDECGPRSRHDVARVALTMRFPKPGTMLDARAGPAPPQCQLLWSGSHETPTAERVTGVCRHLGSVAVSRSAMVVGPETSDVTNDQDPKRSCEQGAQTAALPAGRNADMRTLVRRLPVEFASSGRNDVRASSVGRPFDGAPV